MAGFTFDADIARGPRFVMIEGRAVFDVLVLLD
jgi:hypothetical protein